MNPMNPDPLWAARRLLETQPWYEKFSNTVTASIGALAGALWLGISFGFELPDSVAYWVFLVIGILTALFVRKTPNGVTESVVEKLEDEYRNHNRTVG